MNDSEVGTAMQVREYGTRGPSVILLHGGPGAPGYLAPVARALADSFQVLEPWQRGSGDKRLTVARHVADLHALIARGGGVRPTLAGHSWGAMLALAYAAAHPGHVAALVLIGCGTFDVVARERMQELRAQRMDDIMRQRLEHLPEEFPDVNERLRVRGNLSLVLDSYEPITRELELGPCDARAHQESWQDMLRLQEEGVYPAAFAAITAPVLMLHGAVDPHPGPLIRASLTPYLPQLEYREWERCGHYPWLERAVQDKFFAVLHSWLVRHGTEIPGSTDV
jgi:pimeloyl-ACP methyl ester carboxylesterase